MSNFSVVIGCTNGALHQQHGPFHSKLAAREWAASGVARNRQWITTISIVDNWNGAAEVVWNRDWDDWSNHVGLSTRERPLDGFRRAGC